MELVCVRNTKRLYDLISTNERWLVRRVIDYAKKHGYIKYTSPHEKDWELSIRGLSESILKALEGHNDILQLLHGTDSQDGFTRRVVSFGVTEGKNHRLRGVTLPMFLGLLKYYRLSYIDLIQQARFEREYNEECVLFIERIFDLIELGIVTEWVDFSRSKLLGGLQKANQILVLEKHKYLTIFEKIREPVIVLDDKNRIKEMNQSAAKYFGTLRPSEADSQKGPAGSGEFEWLKEELIEFRVGSDSRRFFEKELKREGEDSLYFNVELMKLFDVGNASIDTIAILNDITESKRKEEALQKSEEKFRSIVEQSNDGFFLTDVEGRITEWNSALEKVTGLARWEVVGQPMWDVFFQILDENRSIELCNACRSAIQKIMKKQKEHWPCEPLEYRIRRSDGMVRTLECKWFPVRLAEGQVLGGIVRDVTEITKVREELLREQRFSQSILNSMHEGLVVLDVEGTQTYANPAFCRMVGFRESTLNGRRMPFPYWPKDEVPRLTKIFEQMLEGKRTEKEIVASLQKKNGEIFFCSMRFTPLRRQDGTPTGWLLVVTDITERKLAEEKMKRRLLRFNLEDGKIYIVWELTPTLSIKAFKDLLKVGYSGLVISRSPREELKNLIGEEFEFLWMSEKGEKESIPPVPKDIERVVERLSRNHVLFLDRLDYLLFRNGIRKTLCFVQRLRELAYLNNFIAIMSIDPSLLSSHELKMLKKEALDVEPLQKASLPEGLLELLRFIYSQNSRGVKPSYKDIGNELKWSKPTVSKKVGVLLSMGYVKISVMGRCKLVEITDKGASLF